jgi:renierapurpurin 18,18'-hydroxylase
MELATNLKGETVRNHVREVGINGNHWYAVAWAKDLRAGQILPVMVWSQSIALFRDSQGQINAVENVCAHKGVAIDKGKVMADTIVCPYHGWEFSGTGDCVGIPYFPVGQKLPRACLQTFPVQEKYGLVWLFPGDPLLAATKSLPQIPEYDDPNWLIIPVGAKFKAHFSICNENTRDVFHGYLHQNLQGWFDPILLKLQETEDAVKAEYQVSYQGAVTKFLGLSQIHDPVSTQVITVDYRYPNYINQLQGISTLYLMRLPVSPQESRSFTLLFLKVRLPKFLVDWFRPVLQPLILHFVFMRFLKQDIEMIESEHENYLSNPKRRYVEVNPAIIAVQRLIVRQYEKYCQHDRDFI